jgi:hypothetical protein
VRPVVGEKKEPRDRGSEHDTKVEGDARSRIRGLVLLRRDEVRDDGIASGLAGPGDRARKDDQRQAVEQMAVRSQKCHRHEALPAQAEEHDRLAAEQVGKVSAQETGCC